MTAHPDQERRPLEAPEAIPNQEASNIVPPVPDSGIVIFA